jgi:hypothetical protein
LDIGLNFTCGCRTLNFLTNPETIKSKYLRLKPK